MLQLGAAGPRSAAVPISISVLCAQGPFCTDLIAQNYSALQIWQTKCCNTALNMVFLTVESWPLHEVKDLFIYICGTWRVRLERN